MRILSLMYFFLTFNFLIFIVFLAFTRLSIVIISVTEMQWHKCMFKHKKNNLIFLCLQGPQADLRLEECTHMGLVNDALKLTFPSNWVNRGKYIAILKFHLYQINIFWKI